MLTYMQLICNYRYVYISKQVSIQHAPEFDSRIFWAPSDARFDPTRVPTNCFPAFARFCRTEPYEQTEHSAGSRSGRIQPIPRSR